VKTLHRKACLFAGLLAVVTSVVSLALGAASGAPAPTTVNIYATYYGWFDNTPPGCATAYSGCASGNGTYADPITFASDTKEFPVGTVLYYPTVEKYFIMEDLCQECTEDWREHGPDGGPQLHHVDLWLGGQGGNEFAVINCEDALTQGLPDGAPLLTPFIENPPNSEPVSSEPLFNTKANTCFGDATSSTISGLYKNGADHECLAASASTSALKVAATLANCRTSKNDDVAFDGAFLIVGGRCLQIAGKGIGSTLNFAPCRGGPRQQWEINPNGTITWTQLSECIEETKTRLEVAKCSSAPSQQWTFVAQSSS
jgi:hypothetical protein